MREAWVRHGEAWASNGRGVGSASATQVTVGNGKNGITNGRAGGLMRGFLPWVMAKTQLPTVGLAAQCAIFYRG